MDRREAKDILDGYSLLIAEETDLRHALDLAIEALGQTETDDCDNFYKGYCSVYEDGCFHQCEKDCINRKQAIEALTGWQTEPLDEDIVRTLEALPPVTPTERTGEWRENEIGVFCSACGSGFGCSETDVDELKREFNFCSNCGAKMKGGTENE